MTTKSLVVLDTNVISELMRPEPNRQVRDLVLHLPPDRVCTTSVTLAEVRFGIARLPAGRRRTLLTDEAHAVFAAFASRVLSFDSDAAVHYAAVVVQREQTGTPIAGFDAQIAAICRRHGATLVTRNTDDFTGLGLDLIDPWLADT